MVPKRADVNVLPKICNIFVGSAFEKHKLKSKSIFKVVFNNLFTFYPENFSHIHSFSSLLGLSILNYQHNSFSPPQPTTTVPDTEK